MSYPNKIDQFPAKLNKKTDGSVYVVEEKLPINSGKYEGLLAHDNITNTSIRVYTGSKLTGEEITNYIVSVPADTPWRRHIKVFANVNVIYVTYETVGDTVEADDVNVLQESMTATQTEVERYKAANDASIKNLDDRLVYHVNDKSNPHTVTVEQIGAETPDGAQTKATNAKNEAIAAAAADATAKVDVVKSDLNGHISDKMNPHAVTAGQVGAYTKAESDSKVNTHANAVTAHAASQISFKKSGFVESSDLQDVATELDADITNHVNNGVHDWSKITGKPNFADPSWKGVKSNKSTIPLTGNAIGDTYVVIDDGDGKGAIYVCKAVTGTFEQQFDKQGDVDFATPYWDSIKNKPTMVATSGLTDAETKQGSQAKADNVKSYADSAFLRKTEKAVSAQTADAFSDGKTSKDFISTTGSGANTIETDGCAFRIRASSKEANTSMFFDWADNNGEEVAWIGKSGADTFIINTNSPMHILSSSLYFNNSPAATTNSTVANALKLNGKNDTDFAPITDPCFEGFIRACFPGEHNCYVSYGYDESKGALFDTSWGRFTFAKPIYINDKQLATVDQIPTSLPAVGGNADTIANFRLHEIQYCQSQRDFTKGTLIQTNIDCSESAGDPFLLEITGNSYVMLPFDIKVQGYIYNNTIINTGGISNGTNIAGMSVFCLDGKLCFWFPRQEYWQGFNVFVSSSLPGTQKNRVIGISNVEKPTNITKEVAISIRQSAFIDQIPVGQDVNFSTLGIGHNDEIWGRNPSRVLWINYRSGPDGATDADAITRIGNGKGGEVIKVEGDTATYKGNQIATVNQIPAIPSSLPANGGTADYANCLNISGVHTTFHWSGQSGQPTWLWGGNNSDNMYVYNPSNFNVNHAETAKTAECAKDHVFYISTDKEHTPAFRLHIKDVYASDLLMDVDGNFHIKDYTHNNYKNFYAANVYSNGKQVATVDQIAGSQVTVLTGTITNGGTVPLPEGYTQEQCKWFVSNNKGMTGDYFVARCYVDENRVVTVNSADNQTGYANYMIIGVK